MEVQPDFRELLALLNAHNVEYMVVGGYALDTGDGLALASESLGRSPGALGRATG